MLALYLGVAPHEFAKPVAVADFTSLEALILSHSGINLMLKLVLFGAAVSSILGPPLISGRLRIPSGAFGPFGFLVLILLLTPGLLQSTMSLHAMAIFWVGILHAPLICWSAFWLIHSKRDVRRLLVTALLVIVGIALIKIVVLLMVTPGGWGLRCDFHYYEPNLFFNKDFKGVGKALAFFVPVFALVQWDRKALRVLLLSVLATTLAYSQVVISTRTGMVVGMMVSLGLTIFWPSRKVGLLLVSAAVLVFLLVWLNISVGGNRNCYGTLQVDDLLSKSQNEEGIYGRFDIILSKRLTTWRVAIEKIVDRPLAGYGIGRVEVRNLHQDGPISQLLPEIRRRNWCVVRHLVLPHGRFSGILWIVSPATQRDRGDRISYGLGVSAGRDGRNGLCRCQSFGAFQLLPRRSTHMGYDRHNHRIETSEEWWVLLGCPMSTKTPPNY